METAEWERNVILSSLEIALMVLSGDIGEDAREHALNALDVSDNEADILEANLQVLLNEEGVVV